MAKACAARGLVAQAGQAVTELLRLPPEVAALNTDQRAEALGRRLDSAETHRRAIQDQLDAERRSAAAYRGHLTRMRNRVARGVCPVAGCKRSFPELHAHVVTCHPELLGDLPELEAVTP